jgi:non-lysosomal glucosylceramidase
LNLFKKKNLFFRCRKFLQKCKTKKIQSHIDFFSPLSCKQIYGAPIGGIGTGSIGRTFTGEFTRFQLVPGIYEHETSETNLFTVNIRKKFHSTYQQTLVTKKSSLKGFKYWNMEYPENNGIYYALYPESWTVYNLPGQNVNLTCHQISPVIPHNYKDSSLPVGLFNWTIENNNNEDIELSLMFTWQSGSASDKFELSDVSSKSFENYESNGANITGVKINQKLRNIPLEYLISARKTDNCSITYNCQFYPDNEESGTQLWYDLLNNGNLSNKEFNEKNKPQKDSNGSSKNLKLAVAVCVQVKVKANSKENIEFSLVWNMPNINFYDNQKSYNRFYTRYFPETNPNSALNIAAYAHANKPRWIEEIRTFQKPILDNKKLPTWYKVVIFNELYYISDGGTVWLDIKDDPSCKHEIVKEYGRFAYLEGHEYRMYNTYGNKFFLTVYFGTY